MNVLVIIKKSEPCSAILEWGKRIAQEDGALYILQASETYTETDILWQEGTPDHQPHQSTEIGIPTNMFWAQTSVSETLNVCLREEADKKPDIVIIQDKDSYSTPYRNLVETLMESLHSAIMVMRLGEQADGAGRVLLPCSGGPHSRAGLKVAARALGTEVTALFIEPNVDEVSKEVGAEQLARHVRRAGIEQDTIEKKVILSNDVTEAIKNEIVDGYYGLLLIGASGSGTLRRKLFGTVPGRLMQGSSAMSIGVIRAERPIGHKIRDRMERLMQLSIPQLKREDRIALFDEIEEKAKWSFDFATLMVLATAIASLGLLADSPAVVIGAMLVAPLMTPLLGGGLALIQGNIPLWRSSQKAVLLGFLSALLVGLIMGWFAKFLNLDITGELAARGAPSILDLGIAFISGIAASYCLSRPKLSGALAGVAIAAALVPPIATTGIAFAMGNFEIAQGAGILFGTNVVAIVIGSAFNFYIAGIKGNSATGGWAKRMTIFFALIMAGLIVPLSSTILNKVSNRTEINRSLREAGDSNNIKVVSISTIHTELSDTPILQIEIEAPAPITKEQISALKQSIQPTMGENVKLRVITTLVQESNE